MKLTEANYYGKKASQEYFSVSQYKSFLRCEAAAMAEIRGEYTPERGRALVLGSYVDEMLTGTTESQLKFIEDNATELIKRNGEKYADVLQADEAIRRVIEQPLMMKYLSGQHQTIMTGEICGTKWKGKFDSYKAGEFLADLKYLKDFKSPNLFENAITYYGYDKQLAVYRHLIYQKTGKILPCYLLIVTKQAPPDVAVVEVNTYDLDAALDEVKKDITRFQKIKNGEIEPERCNSHDCPYCRGTKILTEPIDSSLLGMSTAQIKAMRGEL